MPRSRIGGIFRGRFASLPGALLASAAALLSAPLHAATAPAEKIAVFPQTPYYAFIIYESLAVFWVAILALLVILRLKLREIERVQRMGVDDEDPAAPLLQ